MRATLLFETDPAFEDSGARGEGPSSVDLDSRGNLLVATGSWAGILRAETGEMVRPLAGFGNGRVAEGKYRFAAGGRRVAGYAAGRSTGIFVWDAADGSELDRQEDGRPLLAVSADGRIAVEASKAESLGWNATGIWNVEEGRRLHAFEMNVRNVAIAPDGSQVFFPRYHGEATGHRWQASSGEKIAAWNPFWADGLLTCVPGSGRLLGINDNRAAALITVEAGRVAVEKEFNFRELAVPVEMSLTGLCVVSPGCTVIAFFDYQAGWLIRTADNHQLAIGTPRTVTDACFSADGKRLYAVGEGGLLRAWNIELEDDRDRYGAKPPPSGEKQGRGG